jgi:DNA helicase MCM9
MAWLPELSPSERRLIEGAVEGFLMKHYQPHLTSLITEPAHHYSITVNALELFDYSADMGQLLLDHPTAVLAVCDESLHRLLSTTHKAHSNQPFSVPISQVHMRLCSLPVCPELTRSRIPQTRDQGRLLAVSGTVTRETTVKVLECSRQFQCSRCHHVFTVTSDLEQYNAIPKPQSCASEDCGSIKINPVEGEGPGDFRDYQEVKVQEQVQKLEVGKHVGDSGE